MTEFLNGLSDSGRLRQDAEALLRSGQAPAVRGGAMSTNALQLLYRLASSPDTSSDALTLLHELQTHQVELDMQQAQLQANEHALELQLRRSRALFDGAPVAYAVVDVSGRLIEINRSARVLLGLSPEDLEARTLQEHFAAADRRRLTALLTLVRSGQKVAPCTLRLEGGAAGEQCVRVQPSNGGDEGGEAILMALMPLDDAPAAA